MTNILHKNIDSSIYLCYIQDHLLQNLSGLVKNLVFWNLVEKEKN